jgi:hypothetical protein
VVHHAPADGSGIIDSLTNNLGYRLGLDQRELAATAALEILDARTAYTEVPVGGKYADERRGTIGGWQGQVVIEANAVAAWLLLCAARVGLGGRTALGFGSVEARLC